MGSLACREHRPVGRSVTFFRLRTGSVSWLTYRPDAEILFTSNDSFELLRVLEEVTSNSTYAPQEYLYSLVVYLERHSAPAAAEEGKKQSTLDIGETTKRGTEGAYRKLEQVRLALARNLARALVVGFENPF